MGRYRMGGDELSSGHRRTSIPGFINRMLPKNRPEQGGTARNNNMTDNNDSAYLDLGINPNELTEWNLAQDRPSTLRISKTRAKNNHDNHGASMQQGSLDIEEHAGPSHQVSRQAASRGSQIPKPQAQQDPGSSRQTGGKKMVFAVTMDEIREALKFKEEIRKRRQALKKSGDWLGVQGADPYSGEFVVLTPTDTISSGATPPSIEKKLEDLSKKQEITKLAYERSKLEEEAQRENLLLQKGKSKLERIERAKDMLRRRQQAFPKWNQHKRQWSSAAEPLLSPIPQSKRNSVIEAGPGANATVPEPVLPSLAEPQETSTPDDPNEGSENVEHTGTSKRDRRRNWSTDTIVHKALRNADIPSISKLSTGVFPRSEHSKASSSSSTKEENKKKSFLWWPRRAITDPATWLVKRLSPFTAHPSAEKTEETPVANPNEDLPPVSLPDQLQQETKDHFPSLEIPDWHLHDMPYVDQVEEAEDPSTPTASELTPDSLSEVSIESTLNTTTSPSEYQTPRSSTAPSTSGTEEVTATSSQSSLKGIMNRRFTHRSLFPAWRSQESRVPRSYTQRFSHGWGRRVVTDPPVEAIELQTLRRASSPHKGLVAEISESPIEMNMKANMNGLGMMIDLGGSASTRTIITTGCDPVRQLPFEVSLPEMISQKERNGKENNHSSTVSRDTIPQTLTSPQGNKVIRPGVSTAIAKGRDTKATPIASSLLIPPPSGLQSLVHVHEIPGTDTSSTDLVICRKPCLGIFSRPSRVEGTYLPEQLTLPMSTPAPAPKAIPRVSKTRINLKGQELGGLRAPPKHHQLRGQGIQNGSGTHDAGKGQNQPEFRGDTAHHQRRRIAPDTSDININMVMNIKEKETAAQEAMIQGAARIAMRRSQAKQITIAPASTGPTDTATDTATIGTATVARMTRHRTPSPVSFVAIPNPDDSVLEGLKGGVQRGRRRLVKIASLDAAVSTAVRGGTTSAGTGTGTGTAGKNTAVNAAAVAFAAAAAAARNEVEKCGGEEGKREGEAEAEAGFETKV